MVEGDEWCLVATEWIQMWLDAAGRGVAPPPLDNSGLLKVDADAGFGELLSEDVFEGTGFEMFPLDLYEKHVAPHGGGPELRRTVIAGKHGPVAELYPLCLTVTSPQAEAVAKLVVSRVHSADELARRAAALLGLPSDPARRVFLVNPPGREPLVGSEPLGSQDVANFSRLALQLPGEQGDASSEGDINIPVDDKDEDVPPAGNPFPDHPSSPPLEPDVGNVLVKREVEEPPARYPPGLCGLSNLGNTCFMNSGLQCLSNTVPLCEYFCSERFRDEVNRTNPLGTKGEMALAFHKLIADMWSGRYQSLSAFSFKSVLEKFAPQFGGYRQHDSQELLAFLLDGLHEDLNRIIKKPYVEQKDSDGRPDAVVAEEMWANYKQRNDSIIVDWFQSQLKSTVCCPDCRRESVTFDPVMYFSLPLPVVDSRRLRVDFVRRDAPSAPLRFFVEVPKAGLVADLRAAIADVVNLPPACVQLLDLRSSTIISSHRDLCDDARVSSISEYMAEIHAFEVSDDPSLRIFPVVMYTQSKSSYSTWKDYFGTPFLLPMPADATYDDVYSAALNHLSPFLLNYPPTNQEEMKVDGKDDVTVDLKDVTVDVKDDAKDDFKENVDDDLKDMPDLVDEGGADDSAVVDDRMEPLNGVHRLFCVEPTFRMAALASGLERRSSVVGDLSDDVRLFLRWEVADRERHFDRYALKVEEVRRPIKADEPVTLYDCFEHYTKPEQLGEGDEWYCTTCKEHKRAHKKFDMWSLPKVLVCHLKRFSYANRYQRVKIDKCIDFPLEDLDLSRFRLSDSPAPARYRLFAVSNHYGGLGGGHYTSHALNHPLRRWYTFDDTRVSPLADPTEVVSSAAYVLFYCREDCVEHFQYSTPPPSPDIVVDDVQNVLEDPTDVDDNSLSKFNADSLSLD